MLPLYKGLYNFLISLYDLTGLVSAVKEVSFNTVTSIFIVSCAEYRIMKMEFLKLKTHFTSLNMAVSKPIDLDHYNPDALLKQYSGFKSSDLRK